MDAFDARIIREMGMEPFIAWPRRKAGLRLSEVARRIGRNVQFVKDRVARLETEGVIQGYRLFPNLRLFGMGLTVFHSPADFVPSKDEMSRLAAVDGFYGVVWYLDSGLCINVCHMGEGELARRLRLIAELVGGSVEPKTLYPLAFPRPGRTLSPLDWRIIAALLDDARRPLSQVAEEVGVTPRTVRARYNSMWAEGMFDTCVVLDFERASGIIPFQLAVWSGSDVQDLTKRLSQRFRDRYLDHIVPPAGTYADLILRVFAYTPAEVQGLVRETLSTEGVRDVEAHLATGSFWNGEWIRDLVLRRAQQDALLP